MKLFGGPLIGAGIRADIGRDVISIVSPEFHPGSFAVEQEHTFCSKDTQIDMIRPVGGHRTRAAKCPDCPTGETNGHSVVQIHAGVGRRHKAVNALRSQPSEPK